jgi:hypothetical protein
VLLLGDAAAAALLRALAAALGLVLDSQVLEQLSQPSAPPVWGCNAAVELRLLPSLAARAALHLPRTNGSGATLLLHAQQPLADPGGAAHTRSGAARQLAGLLAALPPTMAYAWLPPPCPPAHGPTSAGWSPEGAAVLRAQTMVAAAFARRRADAAPALQLDASGAAAAGAALSLPGGICDALLQLQLRALLSFLQPTGTLP